VDKETVRSILREVSRGKLGVEEGIRRLQFLPFEDLGFAKVDHHRQLRRGFPEVIFGEGKTAEQIRGIVKSLKTRRAPVLVTRVDASVHRALRRSHSAAVYHPQARAITVLPPKWRPRLLPGVLIVAAGTSDIPVAEEAALTAELMGNRVGRIYDVGVAGLHRLLAHRDLLGKARVVVVVAGMEGALPSVVGGLVDAPVIAVPTSVGYGASFGGLAALLGMLNSCAGGVMVVNIDNGYAAGFGAGLINRIARGEPKNT
jgi:hypothetical protein